MTHADERLELNLGEVLTAAELRSTCWIFETAAGVAAKLDWSDGTVRFVAGDMPIDDAAKIFFEGVIKHCLAFRGPPVAWQWRYVGEQEWKAGNCSFENFSHLIEQRPLYAQGFLRGGG